MAEMKTPSRSVPLQLSPSVAKGEDALSDPGSSMQKIVRFDLKEEGNHVLAVNVSYTETIQGDGGNHATAGRVRTFRKLYQFLAQPQLSVRTKASELPSVEVDDKAFGPFGMSQLLRYALEAQLENVGEGAIVLEQARLDVRPPFKATSLNWDIGAEGGQTVAHPKLSARDVLQVAFLVEQVPDVRDGLENLQHDLRTDGRAVLGQLSIEWKGTMGGHGLLSTGNLLTRRKLS